MGTWGVHSFENDDALEWAAAYRDMGLPLAQSTIEVAIGDHVNGTLTADIAARALAAVEAVALALGRGSDAAAEALSGAPAADAGLAETLKGPADELIMCVTGGSELDGLWKDADWGEHEKWLASLTDLRARVSGAVVPAAVAAEPGAAPSAAMVSSEDQIEGLRQAIDGLTYDIEVLRQEMAESFARLAKRVEELGR